MKGAIRQDLLEVSDGFSPGLAALAEQPFTMKNPPLIGGGFHSHGGTPQKWMVDFRENPSKMDDDLGVPPFMETPRWFSFQSLHLRRPCFIQCLIAGGYACSKGQSYSGCWVSIQSLWEQKGSRMSRWNLAPCIAELVRLVWWMAATMHHISVVDHMYVELQNPFLDLKVKNHEHVCTRRRRWVAHSFFLHIIKCQGKSTDGRHVQWLYVLCFCIAQLLKRSNMKRWRRKPMG